MYKRNILLIVIVLFFISCDKSINRDTDYYTHIDFYNKQSSGSLTILTHFKTFQQTTEYTCGPACALMVVNYFGITGITESGIADIMETHKDANGSNITHPGVADEKGEYGTSTHRMLQYLRALPGFTTISSIDKDAPRYDQPNHFKDWVIENLYQNTPIMVEWIDWWGHWQVIIGYDTMGTATLQDDVTVMADPYDSSDHHRDGYYIVPAERFFYMWKDADIMPKEESYHQWVILKPSK